MAVSKNPRTCIQLGLRNKLKLETVMPTRVRFMGSQTATQSLSLRKADA